MDERYMTSINKVLKKVAALRATLSDEEQEILDRLLVGRVNLDVDGHLMQDRYALAPVEASTAKTTQDVSANIMSQSSSLPRTVPAPQDAEGHSMKPRTTPSTTPSTTPKTTFRIALDDQKATYKFID